MGHLQQAPARFTACVSLGFSLLVGCAGSSARSLEAPRVEALPVGAAKAEPSAPKRIEASVPVEFTATLLDDQLEYARGAMRGVYPATEGPSGPPGPEVFVGADADLAPE